MAFLVIATFKSNKTEDEVKKWLKRVSTSAARSSATVVCAPSFPYLHLVHETKSVQVAAQDVSPFPAGSYTGAVNAGQLADSGVTYCIVGHSERRRYFHESPTDIANKVSELVAWGITPIVCVAEEDIFPQFAALDPAVKDKAIYCYEPPANIGGSEAADEDDIQRVVSVIRSASASPVQVMYGGSVNASNISALRALNLDGLLISSASLDPVGFSSIIREQFS